MAPKLMGEADTLRLKIAIREIRAKHAKGARQMEELSAIESLRAKLAQVA